MLIEYKKRFYIQLENGSNYTCHLSTPSCKGLNAQRTVEPFKTTHLRPDIESLYEWNLPGLWHVLCWKYIQAWVRWHKTPSIWHVYSMYYFCKTNRSVLVIHILLSVYKLQDQLCIKPWTPLDTVMLGILYCGVYCNVGCFITWGYTSVIWVYHNVEAY